MFLVNREKKVVARILPILFVLLSLHSSAFGQSSEDSGLNAPQAKYTADGVAGCLGCHLGDRLTLMANTSHGNSDNPHTPYATDGCESCHGPGSFHSSRARGGVGFPALITFRRGEEPRQIQNQACTGCHEKDMGELKGMKWDGSLHELKGMTCNFCHQLHVVDDGMKDQKLQRQQCSKCHTSKIEAHKGGEGLLKLKKCTECHKVHELTRKE